MEREKLSKVETKKERLKKELKEDWERKSPKFQQFLAEQVFLPPEKWDKNFKDYVEKKYKLGRETEKYLPQWSTEEEKERQLKRSLKFLDLDKNDLMNKKILDLGCGKEGNFVKICLEKGITTNVYGLDLTINPDELDEEYEKYLLKGDFEKEIAGGDYDYITALGSVGYPRSKFIGDRSERTKNAIILALKALKDDGEIRISPIGNAPAERNEYLADARENWENLLKYLAKDEEIEYQFKPFDILVSTLDHNDVALKEVLIIKKKK